MLPAPRKVTRLEAAMNRVVVGVLAALGCAALLLASANTGWELRHPAATDWYLGRQVWTRRRGLSGAGRSCGRLQCMHARTLANCTACLHACCPRRCPPRSLAGRSCPPGWARGLCRWFGLSS